MSGQSVTRHPDPPSTAPSPPSRHRESHSPRTGDRRVAWALRLFGCLDLLAIVAVVMPRDWMSLVGVWSGLAPIPAEPVVGYLARSGSLMYALHGATILYVSCDVPRHRGLIRLLAWLALVHGALLYGIDWHEGMPLWWRSIEGGCVAATGAIVLWLLRGAERPAGRRAGNA